MAFSKCKKCKTTLIDGPSQKRRAQIDSIAIEMENIPTKICPNGCPGFYWYWLDFGVEVIEALTPDSINIAKRSGCFKTHHHCKKCNTELETTNETTRFLFVKKLNNGTDLILNVDAPSMVCPNCQSKFLPAQSSSTDPFYSNLADVMSAALTNDLVYK